MSGPLAFLRELLRIPSYSGEEGDAARRVADEMRALGYDRVSVDDAGNVLGAIEGRGEAPVALLLTHLDVVDAGDPDDWPHPPFAADVADGRVWGRGAVDIKGPLAAQVHGAARAAADGPPAGDVRVAAVVGEEIGGLGARHLVETLEPGLVLVGEPSSNELRRGHRGRAEIEVRARGESAHASAPERGVNPHYALVRFLQRLPDLDLPVHEELGAATVAPTLIRTDQESANVIPGEVVLTLDCRLVPGQTAAALAERLRAAAGEAAAGGASVSVEIPTRARRSWTGLECAFPADNPSFVLPADHPAVVSAAEVLEAGTGTRPPVGVWGFATDGGHLARAGHTVIGFGPGAEELAHTVRESLAVAELEESVEAYRVLCREWPAACARRSEN